MLLLFEEGHKNTWEVLCSCTTPLLKNIQKMNIAFARKKLQIPTSLEDEN